MTLLQTVLPKLYQAAFGYSFVLVCLLGGLVPSSADATPVAASTQTIKMPGDVDVAVRVYPAKGNTLLLWLPSESGIVAADHKIAAGLASSGVEVWLADMHAAYFLPIVPSSLKQIPSADVAHVIAHAQQRGKAVYLLSSGSGAALALQAAALQAKSKNSPRGAVLFSPNLFTGTPQPGEDAKYLPIASRTKLPIFIVQPDRSPWHWRVDELQSRLQRGGSKVRVQSLAGTRDRFYYREDAPPAERAWAARMPELVLNALKSLKETK